MLSRANKSFRDEDKSTGQGGTRLGNSGGHKKARFSERQIIKARIYEGEVIYVIQAGGNGKIRNPRVRVPASAPLWYIYKRIPSPYQWEQ